MIDRNADGTPIWDVRFGGEEYLFGTAPNAFLAAARPHLPASGRALAVADGEGRNGVWLAGQGFAVDAFDASPVGVEKARRLAEDAGATLAIEVADVDGWAWPEAVYDVVAAIFVQSAPPAMRRRLFRRIASALVPGGVLVLQGYRVEQLAYGTGGPRQVEHLYTEAQLVAELAAFELDHLHAHDSVLDEGAGHRGMSALVDVLARRPPASVALGRASGDERERATPSDNVAQKVPGTS